MTRFLIAIFLILSTLPAFSQGQMMPGSPDAFLGRWALFLTGGAGWLEVRQEDGYLDGDLLWYGGSVLPVASVFLKNDTLIITRTQDVVRTRDANGEPVRVQTLTHSLELVAKGDELRGHAMLPRSRGYDIDVRSFTGKRIPPVPPATDLSKLKYGKPVKLFNGKNLDGWTLTDPDRKNGFKVENGVLVNDPVQQEGQPHINYGNLRTTGEFEDFNLKVDVNVPKGSNSGIYLRGLYEVQVMDSYGEPLDSHNMGAIYSRIAPSTSAEKPAGEWQSFDITLCDRHITVSLNGVVIIDNQPVLGVTGGALTADQFSPGPIYLQGDHGKVFYRNIVLKPIL